MKKPFVFVLILFFSVVVVSVISSLLLYNNTDEVLDKPKIIKEKSVTYERVDKDAPQINVYDTDRNRVIKMDMEEYLYGVLSSEMPSTFNEEALKSQAIAARTYVIYKIENNIKTGHKGADICTNSSHCQAYTSYENLKRNKGDSWIKSDYLKIKKAVDETKGQILVYEDKAILPLYFSTSAGRTENSKDIFSTNYPYLISVESPYEEKSPRYISDYSIEKIKFINIIKNYYPRLNLSLSNLNKKIYIESRTEGGSVKFMRVGNIDMSGIKIRKIFNLNSANFSIKFSGNKIKFNVKGYGHGVGMSQYGANYMAQDGYKYDDILKHYYKGVKIVNKI